MGRAIMARLAFWAVVLAMVAAMAAGVSVREMDSTAELDSVYAAAMSEEAADEQAVKQHGAELDAAELQAGEMAGEKVLAAAELPGMMKAEKAKERKAKSSAA